MGIDRDRWAGTEQAQLFAALEQAAECVGLAAFVVHVDARPPLVVHASERLAQLVGRPVEQIVGHPPWMLVRDDERRAVQDVISSRGPGAPPLTLYHAIERPDGTTRQIEVGVARVATRSAELAVCYFRDRTEEIEAINALRESVASFRALVERAPDGICIMVDGKMELANPRAIELIGAPSLEALRGQTFRDFMSPEEAARAAARTQLVAAGKAKGPAEYRVAARPDRILEVHSSPFSYRGKPAHVGFIRDVTERKRLEAELVRADRLAALGTMAATVAHEINNPLTYMELSLERIDRSLAERDDVVSARLRELLADALHGTARIAQIVRDLRTHAQDHARDRAVATDVEAVVTRALDLVDHDLRHRARLSRRSPGKPAIVMCVPGRLEQVLVNVLVNAVQALDGQARPQHEIGVDVEVDDGAVIIRISDSGVGMADVSRVFEPFYTTKPDGQGTGLGLAVCRQLIVQMNGSIELASIPGQGTTVTITLPRALLEPEERPSAPTTVSWPRRRVLIVDDEPLVRRALANTLCEHHDVREAEDGQQALACIAAEPPEVILCDLMMPGMSGAEVYENVAQRFAGLERKIVFVTGGAFVPRLAEFLERSGAQVLRKPFSTDQVLATIARII